MENDSSMQYRRVEGERSFMFWKRTHQLTWKMYQLSVHAPWRVPKISFRYPSSPTYNPSFIVRHCTLAKHNYVGKTHLKVWRARGKRRNWLFLIHFMRSSLRESLCLDHFYWLRHQQVWFTEHITIRIPERMTNIIWYLFIPQILNTLYTSWSMRSFFICFGERKMSKA